MIAGLRYWPWWSILMSAGVVGGYGLVQAVLTFGAVAVLLAITYTVMTVGVITGAAALGYRMCQL